VHERLPDVAFHAPKQQALDRAATRLAAAEQSCGEYFRIVHDQHIAWLQQRGQVRHHAIPDFVAVPRYHHEPRGPARRRLLRDQVVRQIEVEL
jgi:hypothetical protein